MAEEYARAPHQTRSFRDAAQNNIGSGAPTAGHMDSALENAMTAATAVTKRQATMTQTPGRLQWSAPKPTRIGTPDGVGPRLHIV